MRSSNRALSSRRCSLAVRFPLVFSCQDAQQVDSLARAHQIDAGLFSGLRARTHAHHGGHVHGLHQVIKNDGPEMRGIRRLGAQQLVQLLRGFLVCRVGVRAFLGCRSFG